MNVACCFATRPGRGPALLLAVALLVASAALTSCSDTGGDASGGDVTGEGDGVIDDGAGGGDDALTDSSGGADGGGGTTDAVAGDGSSPADAATDDGGPSADGDEGDAVAGCPGAAGCACDDDSACDIGVCLDFSDATRACAVPCDEGTCEAGLSCESVAGNEICVEPTVALCAPCVANGDCQALGAADAACVDSGAGGAFCGVACAADADCPDGYACEDGLDIEGGDVKQCVPAEGAACECSPFAIAVGAKTACYSPENSMCTGERACLDDGEPGAPAGGGLSACSAVAPGVESCDGVDNDCDGNVDGDALCDDDNPCTDDSCDGANGCLNTDNSAPCDDGDVCTNGDGCSDGACLPGEATLCDDGNPCTDDACDPAVGCTATADDTNLCDDSDLCTTEACVAGACEATAIDCDDGDPCTTDSCDASSGQCVQVAIEGCLGKGIVALPYEVTFSCDGSDLTPWTIDNKTPNFAEWKSDALPNPPGAHDGDCSLNFNNDVDYSCSGGGVEGVAMTPTFDATALPAGTTLVASYWYGGDWESGSWDDFYVEVTTDGSSWTELKDYNDTSNGWAFEQLDLSAYVGELITLRFVFETSDCVANSTSGAFIDQLSVKPGCTADAQCDDGNGCTTDSCDNDTGFCVFAGDASAPCDDGDGCTLDDTCTGGGSCAGDDKSCDDDNDCTIDACDPATGACTYEPEADGEACTDGESCTEGDACLAGVCEPGAVKADGAPCNDGNICTQADSCTAGVCEPGPPDLGASCNDADPCTDNDVCIGASCGGSTVGVCDDGDPCTFDSCAAVSALSADCSHDPAPDGTSCDDGVLCTANEVCTAGVCEGVNKCDTTELFFDPFDCGNPNGWVFAPAPATGTVSWAIDDNPNPPGFNSPACSLNFNDGVDYDNGGAVAGSATTPVSLSIPASGTTVVSFASWHDVESNVVGVGYDQMFIEVSDDDFVNNVMGLQLNGLLPEQEWAPFEVELPQEMLGKDVKLRVRFDSDDSIDNGYPGWFIDDLAITHVIVPTDLPCQASEDCLDDGAICTDPVCDGGACNVGPALDCDDGDPCTIDECAEALGGCVNVPNPCDDGDLCTIDSCDAATGACLHEPAPGCSVVPLPYKATFDCGAPENDAWEITDFNNGPAWAVDATGALPGFYSAGCSLNFNDGTNYQCANGKLVDEPGSADDIGVDGYATSPIFDASNVALGTPLVARWFEGGRWSSGSSYNLDLEASKDGIDWQLIDTYDHSDEEEWDLITADLSAYAGGQFQIRFRFYTTFCTSLDYVGAFIDDLVVTSAGCSQDSDCDDLDACTANTCAAEGVCTFEPKECDDDNACTIDVCDGTTGDCVFHNLLDGTSCSDGEPCTENDGCVAGACEGTPKADGASCSDGDACTTSDGCVGGACEGTPDNGKDGDSCSDGDPCTSDDSCLGGVCEGGGDACDDQNPCTLDACEPVSASTKACSYTAAPGGSCDDGDACTSNDACFAGSCLGTDTCGYQPVLIDTFDCGVPSAWAFDPPADDATSTTGWMVDGTPAAPGFLSPACSLNFNDGATYDDDVAIDGTATTPPIALPTGLVKLKFMSYINASTSSFSDTPYIEVSDDGFASNIWSEELPKSSSAQDKWIAYSYDLSAWNGKTVQLRFRFDVNSTSNNFAGWFIDNLQLSAAPPVCGDGACSDNEDNASCAQDCVCGDGVCKPQEDLQSCAADCAVCGDGICSDPVETDESCAADCVVCGDGTCSPGESLVDCPADCSHPCDSTCDGFNATFGCWCDSSCKGFGDCCGPDGSDAPSCAGSSCGPCSP